MADSTALSVPDPLAPSTTDANVERARLRADAARGQQLAALEIVGRQLASMSRAPFRHILQDLIGGRPTPEAIRRFADRYPDRWAQAVSIFGALSGYKQDLVEINVFNIKGLSDSELMGRIAEVEKSLVAVVGPRTNAGATDAEIVSETPAAAESASPAARAAATPLNALEVL